METQLGLNNHKRKIIHNHNIRIHIHQNRVLHFILATGFYLQMVLYK